MEGQWSARGHGGSVRGHGRSVVSERSRKVKVGERSGSLRGHGGPPFSERSLLEAG